MPGQPAEGEWGVEKEQGQGGQAEQREAKQEGIAKGGPDTPPPPGGGSEKGDSEVRREPAGDD